MQAAVAEIARRRFFSRRCGRGETLPPPNAVRGGFMKSIAVCLALLAIFLLAGCADDPEDRNFYYRGWTKPKMSPDDRAYFYGAKTKRGDGPENPKLPSGEAADY